MVELRVFHAMQDITKCAESALVIMKNLECQLCTTLYLELALLDFTTLYITVLDSTTHSTMALRAST